MRRFMYQLFDNYCCDMVKINIRIISIMLNLVNRRRNSIILNTTQLHNNPQAANHVQKWFAA